MEHQDISLHTVSRETFSRVDQLINQHQDKLQTYLEQLLWWNRRVNLVSRDVSRETVWKHIRHSLLLSQFEAFQSAHIIIDAGTGGGLPGLPLALTHPDKHFVLNDLVTKKCLAIKQIAKKLELQNLAIVDGSIEQFTYEQPFLLISKHAFKIDQLYKMTSSLPWSTMVFYKGADFQQELEELPQSEPLHIESYDLPEASEFYRGKVLVFLSRK